MVKIISPVSLIKSIIAALYPPRCLCCGLIAADESPLCEGCLGRWLAERNNTPAKRRDGVIYLAQYTKERSVARTIVLSAKRSNESRLYMFLARELEALLAEHLIYADCIVNVPRSPAAVRKTGFDQAKLLAKALSFNLGINYIAALKHRPFTAVQKTLNAAKRAENAESAYMLNNLKQTLSGKTVILADDVVTTGATLSACEKLIYGAGALRVIKIVIASRELD